jgi:hypothetical protein
MLQTGLLKIKTSEKDDGTSVGPSMFIIVNT